MVFRIFRAVGGFVVRKTARRAQDCLGWVVV